MGRPPCCDKVGIKKGPWTPEEDIILVSYIQEHGPGNWRSVPTNAGLVRCSKSCRLRWTNYLRPGIKRGNFTPHEEGMIIHLQALLGNKWAAIASYLPQRTDNDIKNFWNTHLKKKLKKFQYLGMDSQQPSSYNTTNNYSNNHHNINPFVSKSYNDQGILGANSSAYALSEENISRLLQGWMIRSSSSSPSSYGDRNTKFYGEISDKIIPNVDHHEYLRSAANYGMTPSGDDHDHDQIMEGILSFDCNLMSSEKSSWGSSQKSSVGSVVGDQEKVQFLHHDHQMKDNNISTNPPLSVLEKWLLDESVISQMELPSMF